MAQASVNDIWNLIYNVGGGIDQANLQLQEQQLAQLMESFRREFGMGLLDRLLEMQKDPFNIVNAVQLAGQSGGGPQGVAGGFAETGGLGTPSPFGDIVSRLLEELGGFAGASPINPNTGAPFTPTETAFLRRFEGLSLEDQARQVEYLGGDVWEFLRNWASGQGTGIVPPEPAPPTPTPEEQGIGAEASRTVPSFVSPPGGGSFVPVLPDFTFGRPKANARAAGRGANSGILRGLR